MTEVTRSRFATTMLLAGLLALSLVGTTAPLRAQSKPADFERFDVASIRPGTTGTGQPSMEVTHGGGIRATNATLYFLIEIAYDIRPEQLSGGALWTDSDPFALIAKGSDDGPALSTAEEGSLMQKRVKALLADRFHLELKQETARASGYVLTVDRTGNKMTVANDSSARRLSQNGKWQVRADGVAMSTFAAFLSVHLRAPVTNQTGLDGHFDFRLDWTPDPLPGSSAYFSDLPEDSLIPAVQQQLGLKLVPQKVGEDHYIIERAERPTEN